MNTATITKKVTVLATAVSLIALTSFGLPVLAEQTRGLGGLGGAVGGVAGGVVGGLGKAVSGLSLPSATSTAAGVVIEDEDGKGIGVGLGSPAGIDADLDLNAKKAPKAKLKSTLGGTKDLKAKAGAKVLARRDKANVVVPKAKPKARMDAKVGTGGADPKASSLDENNGGGGGGSADNDGISHEIAGLSAYERQQLRRKCIYVLSSPASFNRDVVQVCRVLAGL